MKKSIWYLGLCLIWSTLAQAQTFEARVNRNQVPEGETFLLTVELDGAKSSDTPDFSVLNGDFTTYSVSNSQRVNIINGKTSQSQQWNLVLMPNNNGKLTIPAISLDKYKTQPIIIEVGPTAQINGNKPNNSVINNAQPRFKIEADVDNRSPFVQQQINYTLTIYDTGSLQGNEPKFLVKDHNDWIIKSLGEPEIEIQNINGKNVREIKFKYALFAQKSGAIDIPAVRFEGFYLTREQRQDPFAQFFEDDMFIAGFGMHDVFATRNPVALTAKPIKINVLPAIVANSANNWWLPAENVKIYGEFVPTPPKFKVGEAVNRAIYVRAVGVIDSQLPELKFAEVSGLKQYPEKPQIETKIEKGKIVSIEKINNVYIPSKAGVATLPEIKVEWFNTQTQTMEKSVLPAMKIKVENSATANANNIIENGINESEIKAESKSDKEQIAAPLPEIENKLSATQELNLYLWLGGAFGLGIILCLSVMGLWQYWLKKCKPNYKKQLHKAIKNKDIHAIRDALYGWAEEYFAKAQILSIEEIKKQINDPVFAQELDKLNAMLYADSNEDWDGNKFWQEFKRIAKHKPQYKKQSEPLPKLYK